MTDSRFSLDWWCEALAARYFPEGLDGHPVTLAVDDDELEDITGLSKPESAEALAGAVRSLVMPGHRFDRFRKRGEEWRDSPMGAEVPPFLPLLALDVLAATRRDNEGRRGLASSYIHLRKLLDPADESTGAPGSYPDTVPWCWVQLRAWLTETLAGTRGDPTIESHDHFVHVGYAWDQALIRASDRRNVLRFFHAVGLSREQDFDISGPELRFTLAHWAREKRGWVARLGRLANDEGRSQYVESFLAKAFDKWDGSLVDRQTGRSSVAVRYLIRSHFASGSPLLQLAIPLSDDPSAFEVLGGADEALATGEIDRADCFAPVGEAHAFRRHDGQLHPDWLSTRKIRFGEQHLLLVRRDHFAEIRDWIDQEEAAEGEVVAQATKELPSGWLLFRGFRISATPEISPPGVVAELLSVARGARTKLSGGLRVADMRHCYLEGGAPTLLLAADTERTFLVGQPGVEALRFHAPDGSFALSALPIDSGSVTIAHDDTRLEFEMIDGLADSPDDSVGTVRLTHAATGRSATGLLVNGPGPSAPVSVDARSTGILLGAQPHNVELVERPDWLQHEAGPLSWQSVASWKGFTPVWFLSHRGSSGYGAQLVNAVKPESEGAGTQWARLIQRATLETGQSDEAQQLWQRYREAAQ